ncbi:unnamed protein product [Didymodactylos carnosus]|uniref:Uncharacterized protein n=1 Tax=Didymodactylos carnosus TaxID=1234261 RepID=A0A815T028_9BILA|nr:unnamed protein product [Didymodactylos carnosus]CAF1496537.1 unnamed protein product [Didymodactylos carnosus]CAF4264878.1 unnamed protein product [Didymodactylos carnosus]CAF4358886.1 unnamed protein product [Didymodactylos carnosus]
MSYRSSSFLFLPSSRNRQLLSQVKLKSKPELADEQQRQKNRKMTQKQRKKQRKHELVLKNLDYRFSFHNTKELLGTANVPYTNLNTAHRNKDRHLLWYLTTVLNDRSILND